MTSSTRENLETLFPGLADTEYQLTSEKDPGYNCVAWAAGCSHRFWDPGLYWPPDAPNDESLMGYKKMFESIGFEECPDSSSEEGYEKIAVFKRNGAMSHVARQLSNGKWTSKLGKLDDIEHIEFGLNGIGYGAIDFFMRRKIVKGRNCPHS